MLRPSIAVAVEDLSDRSLIRATLARLECDVALEVADLAALRPLIGRGAGPTFAIVHIDATALATAQAAWLSDLPLVAVVDEPVLPREVREKLLVLASLARPLEARATESALHIALLQVQRMSALQQSLDKARSDLAARKVIERAKGMLMRHARLDEAEAFRRMREAARRSRQTLAQIAESVILATTVSH
jgi:AmiR/NasT family two-component response regulator